MCMDEKQLSIDIVGLLGACSYALDCIEAELVKKTLQKFHLRQTFQR